jgi:hypothetical protein
MEWRFRTGFGTPEVFPDTGTEFSSTQRRWSSPSERFYGWAAVKLAQELFRM